MPSTLNRSGYTLQATQTYLCADEHQVYRRHTLWTELLPVPSLLSRNLVVAHQFYTDVNDAMGAHLNSSTAPSLL